MHRHAMLHALSETPNAAPHVLVLKSDRDGGASLRRHVLFSHPAAQCTVVQTIAAARRAFGLVVPELFITGMEAPDGDPLDFLWLVTSGRAAPGRSFVVTRHRELWLQLVLRTLPIAGVLDSTYDAPEILDIAFGEVLRGRSYRSLSLQSAQSAPNAMEVRLRQLTPTERLVMGAIGDGRHVKEVAAWLGLEVSSVRASLEALRDKLGANHLGELAAMAAQCGFVRFTPQGSIRVGFGILLADYYLRSQRPVAPTRELRTEYPEATSLAGAVRRKAV
jgi:DNA-binding NarL/FixJ family response regulator